MRFALLNTHSIAKRERQALLLLEEGGRSPYFSAFYGAFKDKDFLYFILEYADGGPLSHQIRSRGAISAREVEVYIAQLNLALLYLQKSNILHRDVKANNVLLSCEGQQVKLIDFGRAKVILARSLRATTFLGVAHYTAPEALTRGVEYGSEVDWWALGVLCFELLHGKPPVAYDVKNPADIISLDVKTKLGGGNIILSAESKEFILAALQPKPSDRRSAVESTAWFLNASENAQKSLLLQTNPVEPSQCFMQEEKDVFKDF